MKDAIISGLNNPAGLEKLYQHNQPLFKREFNTVYPQLKGNALADFWFVRLNYEQDAANERPRREVLFLIIAAIVAGLIAKLPAFLGVEPGYFYTRNAGFIIFPVLMAYFAWQNHLAAGRVALLAAAVLAALVFINLLPNQPASDTLMLSCLHLPFFLWCMLGVAFIGGIRNRYESRLHFLKYSGDLVVITGLMLLAGGLLTGITIGLFSLIGVRIEDFYFENLVPFVLPAAPILGTYLIRHNPQLVGRVSPVIARIFSPLVLVMLAIYLSVIVYSGKSPYSNREFLLIFNALLLGVMALIFFSVAEASRTTKSTLEVWVLFLLSVVTLIVNGIALSAIVFRISEMGLTPNRIAVLGGNVFILLNLVLVTVQLFRVLVNKTGIQSVGNIIAAFLPLYAVWVTVVTFLFPLLFGYR